MPLEHKILSLPIVANVLKNSIFIFGGFDAEMVTDRVSSYQIDQKSWRYDLPRLHVARKKQSACVLGAYLYVACGINTEE